MANAYLIATKKLLKLHGSDYTYIAVSPGTYDIATGGSTSTSTNHIITAYKKHLQASQFNFPNLIGRESAMFYIANDSLAFVPKVKDKISDGSKTFVIDSVQEHRAMGQIALYRIIAVI